MKPTTIDEAAARELELYMDNTAAIYDRMVRDFIPSVKRKIKAGKYDPSKAPALWLYLVDDAARDYCREFGGSVGRVFPLPTRRHVAATIAAYQFERITAGDYPDPA